MRRSIFIVGFLVVLVNSILAAPNDIEKEKEAIKQVIETAYVKGIHIDRDPVAIRSGFHPDFTMLVFKDNQISKVTPRGLDRAYRRRQKEKSNSC